MKKKMKYTEQAVETLDDAGSVIANKNIEIEQLRQRVAELEEVRDAALAEVALLKPNPLCDTGCMLSCKMEADYYEKQITALKSALRDAQLAIDAHLNPCGCFIGCKFCNGKPTLVQPRPVRAVGWKR